MSVLAVDLGSSGVKVALADAAGTIVAAASASLATIFLPDGGAEQDAEGWWQQVGVCARQVMAASGVAPGDVEAVVVTSQYMSIVAVDRRGHPLMNAVMWMDGRGARHHRIAREEGVVDLWLDRHGLVPFGYDDQGHIALIREERPDVYAATAAFVEPVDYLNARMTGRIAATQTTAMPLMTVDNRTHGASGHDPDLVTRSGLDPDKLPPIVPFDEILGALTAGAAEHLGLTTKTVVVTGTVDSITSGVGCGVVDSTSCAVIVGTTTVIVTNIDRKDADLAHDLVSVPSPLPGRWFVMAENGVGGRALDVYLRHLVYGDDPLALGPFPDDAFARAEATAAAAPVGSGGVLFLPWLAGSLAPASDVRVRAGFVNIGLETTRAHLTRAVYEGVALNAAWLLPHVAALAAASWPSVRFGGGGAASPLWAQIFADALGVDVERLAAPTTTNARGAAFLALARLGHISIADIPALVDVDVAQHHEPDPAAHATYQVALERFVDFHERARPFYAALNRRR